MKNLFSTIGKLSLATSVLFMFSCEKDNSQEPEVGSLISANNFSIEERTILREFGLDPNETEKYTLTASTERERKIIELLDNKDQEYYAQGDVILSKKALEDKLAEAKTTNVGQKNLLGTDAGVAGNTTYKVAFLDLTEAEQVGSGDFIFSFNNTLSTTITLVGRNFDSSSENFATEIAAFGANINIIPEEFTTSTLVPANLRNEGLLAAGFLPVNNNPGNIVFLNTEFENRWDSREEIRELLMHELGHSFGLRHSDWATRKSCVDIGVESGFEAEPAPAFLIPGTDQTGTVTSSVMRSCFNPGSFPFYFNEDIRAMRFLFGFKQR